MRGTTRLAVMAHFDPRGEVGPHVRHQAAALAAAVDDLVIVSTAQLTDRARHTLGQFGHVIERPNFGYDFYSYKTGLDSRRLDRYDEVILCNDTYVGPLRSYTSMFSEMAAVPVDFWGFTESARIEPHLQSFFLAFRSWTVQSHAFTRFWSEMVPISDRRTVIRRYEIGLSRALTGAGFTYAPYFTETERDRALVRRRVWWWTAHLHTGSSSHRVRQWWKHRHAEHNPAAGLADRCLQDGRLPYVKLDTLRYDPYGLNASRLLTLCEETFPEEFDGVRSFIESTSRFYKPRISEALAATPAVLNCFRPFVEYRRAS